MTRSPPAVVHSCVVLHALQSVPLGARAVHAELARRLDEHNGAPLDLPEHVLEDIKGVCTYLLITLLKKCPFKYR